MQPLHIGHRVVCPVAAHAAQEMELHSHHGRSLLTARIMSVSSFSTGRRRITKRRGVQRVEIRHQQHGRYAILTDYTSAVVTDISSFRHRQALPMIKQAMGNSFRIFDAAGAK